MSIAELRRALVARIVEGPGEASPAERRAAFDNGGLDGPLAALIDKVALRPTQIADADISAVRAAGVSEDRIFELMVCAAVGQADRQYDSALAALDEAATGKP
jgi:hypothetical protein